ncbi:Z1 domain-containing protein [Novosphingobium decolorationis]|uniref:Z1 domain-containing protein n=1 Tax=Novosphingobium decolorationis TaxID=2698673 RepID=A0ABX8E9D2_9SPHN|nr:Z1 domain-containing protein [Novosphingobium decolorationis]QVM85189.1 Z1 domain-containing protein [Novosphingobium decolorationis]
MTDIVELLENSVTLQVLALQERTSNGIREIIDRLRQVQPFSEVSSDEAEKLARRIETNHGISMGLGAVVHEKIFTPWLHSWKADPEYDPYYWKRYSKLLVTKRLPADVITGTDKVTDTILANLGNPKAVEAWSRKGMVVGHVQSGKTQNYTGLICKAADAGYKLIVVIAGIHNNLRNQTQIRIDEGFVGRASEHIERGNGAPKRTVGVGLFGHNREPVSITTQSQDFNRDAVAVAHGNLDAFNVPLVLVIKKENNTLTNLIDWLTAYNTKARQHGGDGLVDQPMLLIDDEADNASIDINYRQTRKCKAKVKCSVEAPCARNGKCERSTINGHIRDLLALFRRSTYVGYTATPFANIFIDPDFEGENETEDLFPRHFIFGLDAPSNYFGARKVFLDGIPDLDDGNKRPTYVRYITDNEDTLPVKHKIDYGLQSIPESMVEALRCFLVARAIRNLRGQQKEHCSMLVNASRFTGIQMTLRNRLHQQLEIIEDALRDGGADPDAANRNKDIAALKACWESEYMDAGMSWDDVLGALLPVAASARIVTVNKDSPDGLDYENGGEGQTVIAVGGLSLSRGLTLEGLTVSYFLRNSMMYDTLMQMGRWFGYRPNYEDLCRIWMPKGTASWYAHIAEATEELHESLKQMQRDNATPEQFGLAVRSHPSTLMVTARNKMGSGQKTVRIGLSNSFIETARLSAKEEDIEANRTARDALLAALNAAGEKPDDDIHVSGGHLLRDVHVSIIDDFLSGFRNEPGALLTETAPVRRYIRERKDDELKTWDVLIAGTGSSRDQDAPRTADEINPVQRSIAGTSTEQDRMDRENAKLRERLQSNLFSLGGDKVRLSSRGIEKVGLTMDQAAGAEEAYEASDATNPSASGNWNYPDWIYRRRRTKPLLILYTIQIKTENVDAELRERIPSEPIVGWAISFPQSSRPEKTTEYVISRVAQLALLGGEDADDFEEDE